MLPLDDRRWLELDHAYGAATDTPGLLGALAGSPGPTSDYRDEPWFTLWSSLCHQGTIYTASYAAVPHIVRIACETSQPVAFDFYQLPASVEVARATGNGPDVPIDLDEAYRCSLRRLTECVCRHRDEAWDRATLLSIAAALATAKGHPRIAQALLDLDDAWIDRIVDGDR